MTFEYGNEVLSHEILARISTTEIWIGWSRVQKCFLFLFLFFYIFETKVFTEGVLVISSTVNHHFCLAFKNNMLYKSGYE